MDYRGLKMLIINDLDKEPLKKGIVCLFAFGLKRLKWAFVLILSRFCKLI